MPGQIDAPDGFEHYLLKLDGVTNQVLGDPQYFGCIEYAYYRMVFNVIGRNQDDHTKNFCFLMDRDGRWKLSPAFDMSYAYNANGGYTAHHQMTINGKNDDFTVPDLLKVAESIHLKNAEALIADTQAVFRNMEDFMDKDVPRGIVDGIKATLRLEL